MVEVDLKAVADVMINTVEREEGQATLTVDYKHLASKINRIKFVHVLW